MQAQTRLFYDGKNSQRFSALVILLEASGLLVSSYTSEVCIPYSEGRQIAISL